jgi:hypothetical protein
MLCESITEAFRKRLGRRVRVVTLDRYPDEIDLLVAIREHRPHVVVMTAGLERRVPRQVARLLDEYPGLFVLAVDLNTERARTYRYRIEVRSVEELSVSGLLHALRDELADDEGVAEN